MRVIKFENGEFVGNEFFLKDGYDAGSCIIKDVSNITVDTLIALGLYPITENVPFCNATYQDLVNPTYTLSDKSAILTYDVENRIWQYPDFVKARLAAFAKQKDIDLDEVGLLTVCENQTWRVEAIHFTTLHVSTWQAYYEAIKTLTDWLEIEATLPALAW